MSKLLVVLVVALAVATVHANVGEGEGGADSGSVASHFGTRCGAKGGHCETRASCGNGTKIKGVCPGGDDTDTDDDAIVCCVPKRAPTKSELKKLAAKKAAALLKKQKKASKSIVAGMNKLGAKSDFAAAANADGAKAAAAKAVDKSKPEQVKTISHKLIEPVPNKKTAESKEAVKKAAEAEAKATPPAPSVAGAKKANAAAVKKAKADKKKKKAAAEKAKKNKKAKKAKKADKKKKKAAKKAAKKAKKGKGKKAKVGMAVKSGSRGIDVSQRTTKKQWKCLRNAGWEWAVVRGFSSRDKPDARAARSLKRARAAGYKRKQLGVYFYPCAKCGHPKKQLRSMIKQLKNQGAHKLFSTIWLDIEGSWPTAKRTKKELAKRRALRQLAQDKKKAAAAQKAGAQLGADAGSAVAPLSAPKPAVAGTKKATTKKGKGKGKGKGKKGKGGKKQPISLKRDQYTVNRTFFRTLLRECRKLKRYECGVYTTPKDWARIIGPRPIKALKQAPLWYPNVEIVPNADTTSFESFGGWKKAWSKQYSQNQNVCGVKVDINVRA